MSLPRSITSKIRHSIGFQTRESRIAIENIDLLFLAIEALDINAPEIITYLSKSLKQENVFANHVEIWKSRCHNPNRKSSRNKPISLEAFEALVTLLSNMAERLYPKVRDLLTTKGNRSINYKQRELFSKRFNELIKERMNIRRIAVKKYIEQSSESIDFHKRILFILALSSGVGGINRLKSNIYKPLLVK